MLAKPIEEKWKLIQLHEKSKEESENSFKIKDAPEYFVHAIKENSSIENIKNLIKSMKEKDEDWINNLLSLGGLDALFEVLVGSSEIQLNEIKDNIEEKVIAVKEEKIEKKRKKRRRK